MYEGGSAMQVRDRGMLAGAEATDAPVVPGPYDNQAAPAGKREVDLYARTYAPLTPSSRHTSTSSPACTPTPLTRCPT
jgi:hypothetical protein